MGNAVVRRCRLSPRFLFHQSDEATRPMSAKLLQKRFRRMHLCTTKISATFQALSGKKSEHLPAYSALACFRMGMLGSASFQRVRKA